MSGVAPELSQALAVAGVVKLTDLPLFTSEGGTLISWVSALLSPVRAHPGNGGLPDSLAHKVRQTSRKTHPRLTESIDALIILPLIDSTRQALQGER